MNQILNYQRLQAFIQQQTITRDDIIGGSLVQKASEDVTSPQQTLSSFTNPFMRRDSNHDPVLL
jgi:hypothetical protein